MEISGLDTGTLTWLKDPSAWGQRQHRTLGSMPGAYLALLGLVTN